MAETAGSPKLSVWRRKPWIMVVILTVIFIVPVIAAWVLYLNIDHINLGTTQHGEFIQPARALKPAALPLPLTADSTLAANYFDGKFTLVYMSAAFCNPDCEEALILTRQTRIALGPKIESVQRLYLVDGAPANPAKLQREQPDITVANVSGGTGQAFVRQFSLDGKSVPDGDKFIYLVDPRGFYILRYSIAGSPEGLLKDLKHLLGEGGGM